MYVIFLVFTILSCILSLYIICELQEGKMLCYLSKGGTHEFSAWKVVYLLQKLLPLLFYLSFYCYTIYWQEEQQYFRQYSTTWFRYDNSILCVVNRVLPLWDYKKILFDSNNYYKSYIQMNRRIGFTMCHSFKLIEWNG